MYEPKLHPLLPRRQFSRRVASHSVFAGTLLVASLLMGVIGYRVFEGLAWIDALLNASMVLGGMGPVDTIHTLAGKLFASCYALFCGVAFVTGMGIVAAPILHRGLHKFHLEDIRSDRARGAGG